MTEGIAVVAIIMAIASAVLCAGGIVWLCVAEIRDWRSKRKKESWE